VENTIRYSRIDSPLGSIWLASTRIGLCTVGLGANQPDAFFSWLSRHLPEMQTREDPSTLTKASVQLNEYFAGTRRSFELELDVRGTTFQNKVWMQLMHIPYGSTATYGEIARRIDHPRAARAVGAAIGANPLPIMIPCHRVIGAQGDLVGFGGGLENKRTLLDIEQQHLCPPFTASCQLGLPPTRR
jgi:O-6-methylguanine DNA methyltransferase